MKKIRLLSLVVAMVFCVTLCLTACDNKTAGEHDHIWDEGVVTTEPTCHTEGVKTYSCTVEGCKQTQTAPIDMTDHSWDQGEVSREPKCNDAGEKTYKCTNEGCTATKTEPIGKTEHRWNDGVITTPSEFSSAGVRTYTCLDCKTTREVAIDAHADFVEQFYTDVENKTDWSYGAATVFDVTSGNIQFTPATAENGVWSATGVEIGNGAVKVSSAKAAIVFSFTEELPKHVQAMFTVSFAGGVVKAYLVVVGEETTVVTLNEDQSEWTYTSQDAVNVAKGSTVYLVLDADTSTVEGELSFTLYAPCLHVWDQGSVTEEPTCNVEGTRTYKCVSCDEEYEETIDTVPHEWGDGVLTKYPTKRVEGEMTYTCKICEEAVKTEPIAKLDDSYTEIGNFQDDFAKTFAGNSNWEVGVVNYNWGAEDFTYTPITTQSGDVLHNDSPWMDIKGDWMATDGMMCFVYHFKADAFVNFNLVINCSNDGTCSVRWALKGSDNVIKTNGGKASWGGSGKDVLLNDNILVANGDALCILVNKEDGSNQRSFSIDIASREIPTFTGANFNSDFANTLAGNSNWQVGKIDYNWDNETFGFTALNADTEAFKNSSPWMEVKGDWMANDGMVGLAYNFQVAASISFNFALTCGETSSFAIRWALMDKDGHIKTNDGQASWGGSGNRVTVTQDLVVEEGDTLYILIEKGNGSETNQCTFSLVLSPKI
ncbi:MAG: hypothetical protein J1F68_00575 [Clostridiales bacterium]|nr:hypothetical protein [Clostridiales bacterium]